MGKGKDKGKKKVAPEEKVIVVETGAARDENELSPEEKLAKAAALKLRSAESYMSEGHRKSVMASYQVSVLRILGALCEFMMA